MGDMYDGLFPYGTVFKVQREYSADDIRRYLGDIKRAGMAVAVIWPAVYWWEDRNRTGYPYNTGREILTYADKIGLKIIMETGGQITALEYAPDFVMKNEYYAVDSQGLQEARDIGYGYLNYFHPEVDSLVEKQFAEIARAYKDYPALYGYDVFNETMFSSFDRYTLEEFRKWLRNKYKTVDALNDSWDRAYFAWSQVEFTRWLWASIMPLVDYREFLKDALAGIVGRWKGFIKAVDPVHPVLADNLFSMMTYDNSRFRQVDDWDMAAVVDEMGLSYYPKNSVPGFTPSKRAQILNGMHSAAPEGRFWVSELQTHFQSIFSPKTVAPLKDLRQWTWECIAGGARGLIYWKWRPFTRGIQASGRGLVDYRGRFNERTEEVSSIAGILQGNAGIFNRALPLAPKTAILYDKLNHSIHRAFLDGYTHLPQNIYIGSLEGVFRALWDQGVPSRFIRAEDLCAGKIGGINAIFITAQILMTAELGAALIEFARNGGTVFIDGKLGVVNEQGILNPLVPGGGLSEALGIEFRDLAPEGLDFTVGGLSVSGFYERDFMDITKGKAEILGAFSDGEPALIRSPCGQGAFYYIPTYLWFGLQQEKAENAGALMKWLLEKADTRVYALSGEDIKIQVSKAGNEYLVYAFDYHHRESVRSRVELFNVPEGSYRIKALYGGNTENVQSSGNLSFDTALGSRGVEIYHITP